MLAAVAKRGSWQSTDVGDIRHLKGRKRGKQIPDLSTVSPPWTYFLHILINLGGLNVKFR